MFIVNKNGDECEQVRAVSYYLDYDELVKGKLREIHRSTLGTSYHFGSTQRAEQVSEQRQEKYLTEHKCEKILHLLINGNVFAKYEDVEGGEKVFQHILNSIENNRTLVDLSKLHIFNL